MKNITNRQMNTLFILICVLIIVIAVQYFFRPVLKQKNELSEQIENMQSEYDVIHMDALCYEADTAVYQNNKNSLDDQRKQLLPLMKSNELDSMITKIFIEKGLVIESLEISEIKADTVSILYKNTDEDDIKDSENDKTEKITETKYKPYDLSEYPDGAKIVIDEKERIILEYQTGEYSCHLRYTVSGTYKDILNLVNEISTNNSLQVSSFYFINKDAVSADCVYQADIGITAYMYDSLNQSDTED